jgi:hypothetical protein
MEKKHGKTQYDMERSKSCTDGIGLKVQTMELKKKEEEKKKKKKEKKKNRQIH